MTKDYLTIKEVDEIQNISLVLSAKRFELSAIKMGLIHEEQYQQLSKAINALSTAINVLDSLE